MSTSSSKKKANKSREEKARKYGKYLQLEDPKGYSGTFRWNKDTIFPRMPGPFRDGSFARQLCYESSHDWGTYLRFRVEGKETLEEVAKESPYMLDGLSFPLTIIRTMINLKIEPSVDGKTVFNIVVIGASEKAEQRVAQDTNYFEEIGHAFPNSKIRLWITGPEVGMNVKPKVMEVANMDLRIKKCKAGNFVLGNEEIKQDPNWRENTIFVGFNCGFGNFTETGRIDLLLSWVPDLYILASLGVPIIFTCANEADWVGEVKVHLNVVGSKYVLSPFRRENVFQMATVFNPEEQDNDKGAKNEQKEPKQLASNGNNCVYAIKNFDPEFRVVVTDVWSEEGRRRLTHALTRQGKGKEDLERRIAILLHGSAENDFEEWRKREVKDERPSQRSLGRSSQPREEGAAKEPDPAERREERREEGDAKGKATKSAPKPALEQEPTTGRSSRPVTPSEPPATRTRGRSSPTLARCCEWSFEESKDGQKVVARLRLPESVNSKEDVVLDLSDRTIKCTELASGDCWLASVSEAVKPNSARAGFNMQKRVLKVTFEREA